jgi:hypothetical protein
VHKAKVYTQLKKYVEQRRVAKAQAEEEEARELIEHAVCESVLKRARFERTVRGQEQALTD